LECAEISGKLSDQALTQRIGNLEDNHRLPAAILPLAAVDDKHLKKREKGKPKALSLDSDIEPIEKLLFDLGSQSASAVFPRVRAGCMGTVILLAIGWFVSLLASAILRIRPNIIKRGELP
jgi:hypothetical protein